jgi:hypothetical protein
MTDLPQLIVGIQGMRPHDLVARAGMGGQDKSDRWRLSAIVVLSLERETNRVGCSTSRATASMMAASSWAGP